MDSCNLFRVSSRLNLDGSMCFWPGWIPFCPPKVAGCKLGQSWHRRPLQPGILLCSKSLRQLYTEKEKNTIAETIKNGNKTHRETRNELY